jgi:hypothetical protein
MGLFSAIAGVFAGGAQKKASQKATDAMVGAMNRGIDTQNAFQQQTRSDYMPYTTAGNGAVTELGNFVNGGLSADELAAKIKENPLYASLYDNGAEALLQNASATGGLRGGNTQRGLADFGADTMAKVYQQIISSLSGVANLGLGAQGAVTQTGANVTDNVTNLMGQIGQTQAGNFITKGGINAANFNTFGAAADQAAKAALPGAGKLGAAIGKAFF